MNMKKQFLLFSALLLMSAGAMAQSPVKLGLKAHPLFSYMRPSSDYHERVSPKLGFSYGLMVDYNLTDNYAFATEFSITSLGGKVEFNRLDTAIETSLSMRNIEIPLTLKLKTNDINGITYYGRFGLGTSFNIKSSTKIKYQASNAVFGEEDIKNANRYINPIQLSLIIGGGMQYEIGDNLSFMAGITYSNGFTNVISNKFQYKKKPELAGFDATVSYFAINLGLLF